MADVKPVWFFVAGVVVLCVFLVALSLRGPWLGPGGTRRPWLGPGGTRMPWLGPGGTRPLLGGASHYSPYETFSGAGGYELSSYTGKAEPFQDNPSTLYMIGVDWCPHCKSAKPGFMGLGATTTIAGQPVAFQYLDGEKDKDRLPPCEVGGYPTFCFVHKGKAHRYQGPRSAEGYTSFVQKVLSNGSA